MKTAELLRQIRCQRSPYSLEVGEDDQTDDQGHNGQDVTHHSQVVETDGKLDG